MLPAHRKYSWRRKIFTFCKGELGIPVFVHRQADSQGMAPVSAFRGSSLAHNWKSSLRDFAKEHASSYSDSWGWYDPFSVNQLLCFAIDILLPKYSLPYTWFWLDAKTRNASWRQQSTQLVSRPPCVPHGRRRDEENVRVSTLDFVTQFDADTSVEPLAKLYIAKRYKAFSVQIIAQCAALLALCFLAQCIWIIT